MNTEHRLWGARAKDWRAFMRLALPDIRPVVMNPHLPTLASIKDGGAPVPAGKLWSKSPSRKYEIHGKTTVGGFRGWTNFRTQRSDVETWMLDSDIGFGLVANAIKAIDLDIDEPELAKRVDDWFCSYFDFDIPYRYRENSPRKMLIYRLKNLEKGRSKIVVPLEGKAQVEFLFDRSFFVACGKHHTGVDQLWQDLPSSYEGLPVLDNDKVQDMINKFIADFAPDNPSVTSELIDVTDTQRIAKQVDTSDDLYNFVLNSPYFNGVSPRGEIYVRCPWQEYHTKSAGKADETVFFPKGLGGQEQPGFKCMHTSHGKKTIADFMSAIGYVPEDFPVEEPIDTRPPLILFERNRNGIAPATVINIMRALRHINGREFSVRYDSFEDAIWIRGENRKWERMQDTHYVDAADILYTKCQIADPNIHKLRQCVEAVAKENRMDSGLIWLNGISWDGIDRSEDLVHAMSAELNPYSISCAKYLMTSMAARLANPNGDGIQVDMSLILASRQGEFKTSFLKALAPKQEWYTAIDLSVRDDNTARLIRGKAIVEMAELRGMAGRDAASIRAWMTSTYDEYIPKYKEAAVRNPRRCVFVGTTNNKRFLVDPTGNRRWLPMCVAGYSSTGRKLNVDWVKDNVQQLWAQGYEMYRSNGIAWQDAQQLAKAEHSKFRLHSVDEMAIVKWLEEVGMTKFRTLDVIDACRIKSRYPQEVEAFLLSLGFTENNGLWTTDLF